MQEFHAWECISLIRRYSSLDFIVKDEGHLAALFHCLWRHIYGQVDSDFMSVFSKLKFKMKLGFECWRQGIKLQQLVLNAIS